MRIVVVLLAAAIPAWASSAAMAAISPTRDAGAVANSIVADQGAIASAAFDTIPADDGFDPPEDPVGLIDSALGGFPLAGGTFAILTSGDVKLADDPNGSTGDGQSLGGGNIRGDTDFDVTILRVAVRVPPGANCLSVDFRFLSEEYPEFVGGTVNDAFIAEVDNSTWTTQQNTIVAPDNFAFDPATGREISVNASGAASMTAEQAAGTTYDGATPPLRAARPVTPGAHTLFLSIFDQGDNILDSAVFVDNVVLSNRPPEACTAGARTDFVPPVVTLTNPTAGSTVRDLTPSFGGAAGTAGGDLPAIAVDVFAGTAPSGTPVQTLGTTAVGGSWLVDAPSELAPGTYTAQARQGDTGGNLGLSGPVTFTVAPRRIQDLSRPGLGEDVNVAVVRGTVLIGVRAATAHRGRVGASQKGIVFVPLTEARQIPVGSFLNTRRGTVRLVSATGSRRRNRTQAGTFNAGLFQVLQSRRRRERGLTELRLKGSSFNRCRRGRRGRGSASAAQLSRRTIRRVRGNANGNFRTRGRHSAATVRGTIWITADRCDGTLTTVKRGKVAVRDFRRKRTITLRRGKSYLARAPR